MRYTVNYGYSGNVNVEHGDDITRFVALENDDNAAYWIDICLDAPIKDTYIMIPACAYNGNRLVTVQRKYPPMFTEEEFGLYKPLIMTDVPHLAISGDSFMDVTTGDMAMPCVCLFDKRNNEGFIVVFDQGAHGLNHGVCLDQTGDELRIRLRTPAKRRLVYRWYDGYPSLRENADADAPLKVCAGDKTAIHHKIYSFPCADINGLYTEFFKIRSKLCGGKTPANLPFSHYWELSRKLADECFIEGENFYSLLSLGDSINAQWQAGWVGGGMYTLPLISEGTDEEIERSIQTLEFAARHQSNIGWYYGVVHNGVVRHDCFRHHGDKHSMILVRKHADLTYFMWKQIYILREKGIYIPESVSNSAYKATKALIDTWNIYRQLGQLMNAEAGKMLVGGTTSGAITPAALCAAYVVTGDESYLAYARNIGEFFYKYSTSVGLTIGGPGEILQAPDSESAAALLESYVALYEADEDDKWIDYAKAAAHQLASWVVAYDYEFPPESKFGKLGIHTIDSVWANVQNKHSAPGLCTSSPASLLKLYRATNDPAYMDLMRDIARFIPQTASYPERPILKTDGEYMNPGEICERVNMSDWEGLEGVGDSIFGGCTWPEVAMMLTYLETPGVYVDTDSGRVWAADHVEARIEDGKLIIANDTQFDAEVKVMVEDAAKRREILGVYWQEMFTRVNVPAHGSISLDIQAVFG